MYIAPYTARTFRRLSQDRKPILEAGGMERHQRTAVRYCHEKERTRRCTNVTKRILVSSLRILKKRNVTGALGEQGGGEGAIEAKWDTEHKTPPDNHGETQMERCRNTKIKNKTRGFVH